MKNAELKQIYQDKIDLYGVLEFDYREISSSQIRKRFRQLALEYHPDKNPGDEAVIHKFHLISLAADILGDEQLRREYDFWWDEQATLNRERGQRGELIAQLERREKRDIAAHGDINNITNLNSIQKKGEYLRKLKHFNIPYDWSPKVPTEQAFWESSTLRLEIEIREATGINVLQEPSLKLHLEFLLDAPIHSIYYSTRNRPGDSTVVAYAVFLSPQDSRLIYKHYKDQPLPSLLKSIQPRIPINYYKHHEQAHLEPRIETLVTNSAVQID